MNLKSYASLVVSSGSASAISFLSYPLLLLIYPLEAFGVLGVSQAYGLVVSSVILLRVDYFLLNSPSRYVRKKYLAANIFLFFPAAFTLVCMGVIWYLLKGELIVLYVASLASGFSIYNFSMFFLVSSGRIMELNKAKLIRAVLIVLFQWILYLVGVGGEGLIIGVVAGTLLATFYMCWVSRAEIASALYGFVISRFIIHKLVKDILITRWHDIRFQLPQTLINSVVNNSMPIAIELLYGVKVAGIVVVVEKFIRMPLGVIVDALRPVLIRDLSDVALVRLLEVLRKFLLWGMLFGVVVILVAGLFAAGNFSSYYSGWDDVRLYVIPVALMGVFALISTPILCALQSLNRSLVLFGVEFSRFILLVFAVLCVFFVELSGPVFYVLVAFCNIAPPVVVFYRFMYIARDGR